MVYIAVANLHIHPTRGDIGSCDVFEQVTVGRDRFARKIERVVLDGSAVAPAELNGFNGHGGLLVLSDKAHDLRFDRSRKFAARFLPGVGHLAGEFHEV